MADPDRQLVERLRQDVCDNAAVQVRLYTDELDVIRSAANALTRLLEERETITEELAGAVNQYEGAAHAYEVERAKVQALEAELIKSKDLADVWLARCLVSENRLSDARRAALAKVQVLEAERDQCAPYLKEGETPAECICRNRADVDTALGLLAQEKARMGKIKAIRNEADYDAALLRIDALMDAEPGTPEGDELDVLTDLVEHYEGKYVPMEDLSIPGDEP